LRATYSRGENIMKKILRYGALSTIIIWGTLTLMAGILVAQEETPPPLEDPVGQGAYLTYIAGCIVCHTPFQEQFNDEASIGIEELQILTFSEVGALDTTRLFAGGRVFPLGPIGSVTSKNLTPDTTGIGDWTDEEIEAAIRTGLSHDGHILFPLMPYPIFNQMADSDIEAIITYLRELEPIENEIDHSEHIPSFPEPLPMPAEEIVAPDPSDIEARGQYLVTAVMPCSDCHTPVDPNTGAPDLEKYLAGGQPLEGPWGIVYGGNITPDEETGLGSWTDDEIKQVLTRGIRPDGRRVAVMPWQITAVLTPEDLDAVVYFLRNQLPPVHNEVPAAALEEGFEVFAEPEQ
jgi:mono/diheme cytochrome c family protein